MTYEVYLSKMIKKIKLPSIIILLIIGFTSCQAAVVSTAATIQPISVVITKDSVAERMLLYQRSNGGWAQVGGNVIDYNVPISAALKAQLLSEKGKLDTEIDDKTTTSEIKYLVTTYKNTNNPDYKKAAENGIKYLLIAQNPVGGWGQFYPDTSSYRKHITYNDNAMIDVMGVLKYAAESTNDFDIIDKTLILQAKSAMEKGIACILKTQIVQKGVLTAWCAQHDRITLKPAKARAFELPSISGNESVGITQFLMSIDNPSTEIKKAINASAAYFESVKIVGIRIDNIVDASQPSGKDRVVVTDPNSTLWARFYDLDANLPFFTGRDGVQRANLADIENERRIGYAYYGNWPAKLLSTDYPAWVKKWEK
jgi:PelA/Pel-15E family pectate lyase